MTRLFLFPPSVIQSSRMKTSNLIPCAALRPYISRYWAWDGESELPTMLPGTGAELMFHYAQPVSVRQSNGMTCFLPRTVLLSPRNGRFALQTDAPAGFISVRFRSGALRHFCRMPSGELIDKGLSAADIWGQTARVVEEKVAEASQLSARVRIIEDFLWQQWLACRQPTHAWLDDAFRWLYSHSNDSLPQLAADAGVSIRQFQKVFKQYAGVSPKYFQRVARLENIMRRLLVEQRQQYLNLALDHGFYDQAHFIKDFKRFAGDTPSRYLCAANFRTHFYNASLTR